jgi:hypothetical protein
VRHYLRENGVCFRETNVLNCKTTMLLPTIDSRLAKLSRAIIRGIRLVSPRAPVDILKVFRYRPELFGKPFCVFAQAIMRGQSDWSEGERELMGSFVSGHNRCSY